MATSHVDAWPTARPLNQDRPPLALLAAPFLCLILAQPVHADTQAIELSQRHFGTGKQKITVTDKAVRIEHMNTGIVAITRYPFNKVEIINPGRKNYVTKPMSLVLAQMRRPAALVGEEAILDTLTWSEPQPDSTAGIEAVCYTRTSPKKSWGKLWTLKAPTLPDPVAELVSSFSGCLPIAHGLPLRYEMFSSQDDEPADPDETLPRKPIIVFETNSSKVISIQESIFHVPRDFASINEPEKASPGAPPHKQNPGRSHAARGLKSGKTGIVKDE